MTCDEANVICRTACRFGDDHLKPAPALTPELQDAWLLCTQPDVMFDLLELFGVNQSVALGEVLGEVYAAILLATDWHMTADRPEPGCEHVAGADAVRKIVPALVALP